MKNLIKRYVLWTYVVFYIFILLIGAIMMLLQAPIPSEILKVVSAWTPTFVFIAMFKKIYKQDKLLLFIKQQFKQRIKLSTLVCMIIIQVVIFAVSILLNSGLNNIPVYELVTTSGGTLLLMFLNNIIRGPLGEELGWRGFLLNELQKDLNPLKSAIIVGLLWGFWHTPLWLLSGYEGLQVVQYSVSFLIGIISASIIMTVFYNLNHTLAIPIIFHQLFNFLTGIQKGDQLNTLTVTALMYLLAAVILILINYRKCLYGTQVSTKNISF